MIVLMIWLWISIDETLGEEYNSSFSIGSIRNGWISIHTGMNTIVELSIGSDHELEITGWLMIINIHLGVL